MKALVAHTYIGTLIQACLNEQVEVMASLEDDAFGAFTKTSIAIQQHNWPDVKAVGHKSLWPYADELPRDNQWFVIAHPPCAGGSMVTPTHARGGLDNPKSAFHVTKGFMKYAYEMNPPIIAVESVPGTLKFCGGDLFKIRDEFGPNYGLFFVLDYSKRYGCGSLRKRLWHVHYRKDLFPDGLDWERGAPNERSIRELLGGAQYASNFVVSRTQRNTYERFAPLFEALPQGDYANNWLRKSGRWELVPPEMVKTKKNGEQFVFYESVASKKLAWDKPAPTITGSTLLIHPEEPRPLTTREYLRINGMPDSFEFPPSVGDGKHITYIGKTVSMGIAQWVIQQIKKNLETLR